MRVSAVATLAVAGLAAAQTASAPAAQSTCQAENIVQACIGTIQPQINSCGANDWVCLCNNYQNLLTCYNNCPGDIERTTVQNQVTSYCNAAAPILSASLASAASAGHTMTGSVSGPASTTVATATSAAASKSSGTASAASASSTGAAGSVVAPVSGVLALVFGLAGLL